MTTRMDTREDLVFPAEAVAWAAMEEGSEDFLKSRTPTAKKSSRRFPKKPARVFLKSRRNNPLAKFTGKLKKSCATNTASASLSTNQPSAPDITKFIWPPSRKN